MLIGVLYTGEFRTCKNTIPFMKQNILLNKDVHVFATVQSDDNQYCKTFIMNNMGDNLKHFDSFKKTDLTWESIQNELLSKMLVHPQNLYYLKTSGSMIEYYQSYLSFQQLILYEKIHNIKYDYIVRLRTDVIYTQPLTFDFLNMTVQEIKMRLTTIRDVTNDLKLLSLNNIKMFFNNLLCINNNIERVKTSYSNCDIHANSECYNNIENLINSSEDEDYCIDKLRTFIIEGNYIITLRKNVFFIVKRNLFTEVSKLGITYGTYMNDSNPYWWNSESQLQEICKLNKITIFDSTTVLEDKSLYEYSRNNYISETNILNKDLECLFFICRN